QPRFRRHARSLVQLVQLRVRRLITGIKTFVHDYVARRASANSAARMVQPFAKSLRKIQNAARQTVVTVRNLLRIDLHGLAVLDERDLDLLGRRNVLGLFDIRILTAHSALLLWRSRLLRDTHPLELV